MNIVSIEYKKYKENMQELATMLQPENAIILYLCIANKSGAQKEIQYFAQALGYTSGTKCLPIPLIGVTQTFVPNLLEQLWVQLGKFSNYETIMIIAYDSVLEKLRPILKYIQSSSENEITQVQSKKPKALYRFRKCISKKRLQSAA